MVIKRSKSIKRLHTIKRSKNKKSNLLKKLYGGSWEDLFRRRFTTDQEVSRELGIERVNGIFTINRDTYQRICDYLIDYRNNLVDINYLDRREFYYERISNFLSNVNLITSRFTQHQSQSQNTTFYFHFYDGILFRDVINYNDVANPHADDNGQMNQLAINRVPRESDTRPHINNIVIASIFITMNLFNSMYNDITRLNENLEYGRDQQQRPLLQRRVAEITQQYITIIQTVVGPLFLSMFTTSLVNILRSTLPRDISYANHLNDTVIDLYRILIILPRCDYADHILNTIILLLYENRNIAQRFSFLRYILSNDALATSLARSESYNYALRINDMALIINLPGQTPPERDILFFKLIANTIDKMLLSRVIRLNGRPTYYDIMTLEFVETMGRLGDNRNQLEIADANTINNIIKKICDMITTRSELMVTLPPDIINADENTQTRFRKASNEILSVQLFFLRVIIYNNLDILHTFLVTLLSSMISGLVRNRYISDDLRRLLGYFIILCYNGIENSHFCIYLVNNINTANDIQFYGFLRGLTDDDIVGRITTDFHNLRIYADDPTIAENYMDEISDSFIIKLGVAPPNYEFHQVIDFTVPPTQAELEDLMFLDTYTWKRMIFSEGRNPYSRQPMTLEYFDRFQARYADYIAVQREEKRRLMRQVLDAHR